MWLAQVKFMRHGMHKMGFAQTNTAIEKQRVKRNRPTLGDPAGGGMGQFIGLADDKAVKGKSGIKRGAGQVVIIARPQALGRFGFGSDGGFDRCEVGPWCGLTGDAEFDSRPPWT